MSNTAVQMITELVCTMTEAEIQQAVAILQEKSEAVKKRTLQAKNTVCNGLLRNYNQVRRFRIESVNGEPVNHVVVALGAKTLDLGELTVSHSVVPETDSKWWVENYYLADENQTDSAHYHYYWELPREKAAIRPALVIPDIASAGLKIGDQITIGGENLTVITPVLALRNECLPGRISESDYYMYKIDFLRRWFCKLAENSTVEPQEVKGL